MDLNRNGQGEGGIEKTETKSLQVGTSRLDRCLEVSLRRGPAPEPKLTS